MSLRREAATAPARSARRASPLRADERRRTSQLDAIGRVALLVPIALLTLGRTDHTQVVSALLVLRAVLAAAELGLALGPGWRRLPPAVAHVADALVLGALLGATGAASSPLVAVLVLMPVAAGAAGSTANAAALGLVSLSAFAGAVVAALVAGDPVVGRDVLAGLGATLGAGAGGVALARVSQPLVLRAARTRSGTSRLLNAGLNLEDRERRRVSQQLHEGALQSVLAARQEVGEGDQAALIHAARSTRHAIEATRLAADALDPEPGSAVSLQERLRAALERGPRGSVRVLAGTPVPEEDQEVLLDLALRLGDVLERDAPPDAQVTARVEVDDERTSLWVDTPGDLGALRRRVGDVSARADALGCAVLLGAGGPGRTIVQLRLAGPQVRTARAAAARARARARGAATVRLGTFVASAGWVLLAGPVPGDLVLAILGLCLALAIAAVAVVWSGFWPIYPVRWASAPNVVVLALAVATTGGSQTPLVTVMPALPLALVWVLRGRGAVELCLGSVGAYVVGSLAHLAATGDPPALGEAGRYAAAMAWTTGMVAAVGGVRARLVAQAAAAEAERRAMLADSLAGAGADRSRLAGVLRDGALAWLEHSARTVDTALGATPAGRQDALTAAALGLGRATSALRAVADELHPPALEHGGLRAAVQTGIARLAEDAGLEATVRVDDAAGGREDGLVLALLRELILNVCRHADASQVAIDVHRGPGGLELEVRDDGRGMAPDRPALALAEGRRGLAVGRERVEGAGGWLGVDSTPGRGTTVAVRLPGAPPLVLSPGTLTQVG